MTEKTHKKLIEPGFWHIEYDENGNAAKTEYYDSFRRLVGLTEEDLANTNDAWFAKLHPEDEARVNAHLEEAFKKTSTAPTSTLNTA
jgi:PAS fold.